MLVDRALGRTLDLGTHPRHEFLLGRQAVIREEARARFLILVGDDGFIEQHQQDMPVLPGETALHDNYPNPFNPCTTIRYELARPGPVRLQVYDLRGALVRTLQDGNSPAGGFEIGWNGEDEHGARVASGVYFYRLSTPGFSQTRKMVLIE